jgi:hypothetical protein
VPVQGRGATARRAATPRLAPQRETSLDHLQATAGNAAVVSLLLRTPGAGPVIQRYEAGEHSQFGGKQTMTVSGVVLTEGEVIAMGDFFDSPGKMQAASKAEIEKLRDLIRRDQQAYLKQGGATPVGNKEWDDATGGRYLKLAADNIAHFAPPGGTSGLIGLNHKARWYDMTKQALHQAWMDGRLNGGKVSNEAQTVNSFAAHFLTDAFSAGHLINKPTIMGQAQAKWNKMKTEGLFLEETAFTKAAASAIVNDKAAGAELAKYELKLVGWGDVTPQRFSEFMFQVAKEKPDKFFNAFARTVHDELDRAIEKGPTSGVEVTNDNGTTWFLSGDASLLSSPDTLKVATEAVAESNRSLAIAARAQSEPDYAGLQAKAWAYTPRPTAGGQKLVDDIIKRIADPNHPDAPAAIARLTISELPTAIAELQAMGYMRVKQAKAPTPRVPKEPY